MTGRAICYLIGFLVALLWFCYNLSIFAGATKEASAVQVIQMNTEFILSVVIPYCFTRLLAGCLKNESEPDRKTSRATREKSRATHEDEHSPQARDILSGLRLGPGDATREDEHSPQARARRRMEPD